MIVGTPITDREYHDGRRRRVADRPTGRPPCIREGPSAIIVIAGAPQATACAESCVADLLPDGRAVRLHSGTMLTSREASS